jgi:4-hydroxybenzoate polyprenyltransferase
LLNSNSHNPAFQTSDSSYEIFTLLVKISRPLGWITAPLVFSIGLFYSGAKLTPLSVLQILLLSFPYCILLYGINDIYDYRSDTLNPRKTSINLDPKYHSIVKRVSSVVALLLITGSVLTLNVSNILATISLLFFSYYYSAPPLRFKERPPLDSFSNGVLFFIVFSIGWSLGKDIFDIPAKIYFVSGCVMGIHSFSTVMDYTIDKEVGDKTFAVIFGKRTASVFALVLFISTLMFSKIGRASINYYVAFCSLLFLIASIFPKERLAFSLFKLIFVGFVVTAIIFLVSYL